MDMKMFSYKLFGTKLKISFQIKLAYRTAERERKKKIEMYSITSNKHRSMSKK